MATFRLTASPTFPEGSFVGAYPKRTFAGPPPVAGEIPGGAPLATSAKVEHGVATLEGLEPDTAYFAGAQVGAEWRWVGFRTAPVSDLTEQQRAEAAEAAIRAEIAALSHGETIPRPGIVNPGPTTSQKGIATEIPLSIQNATSSEVTGLPAGMVYDPVSFRIHGTPTTAEAANVTIRASGQGGSSEVSFVWTITTAAVPTLTKPADQTVEVGQPAELQVLGSNVTSWAATGLPAGLSLNVSTGRITGTPTTVETPETTVTAKGPGGETTVKWKWTVTGQQTRPFVRSPEQHTEGTGTTFQVPEVPGTTELGDELLICVHTETGPTTLASIPTGWTQVGTVGSVGTHRFYVLSKVHDGSSMPLLTGSGSTSWDVRTFAIAGGEAVDANSGWNDQASSTTLSIASVTSTQAADLALALTCKVGGTSETTPAGWAAYNSKNQFRAFTKTLVGAEASGATSSTLGVAEASTAITLAIKKRPVVSSITDKLSGDGKSVEPVSLPGGTAKINVRIDTGEASTEGARFSVVPSTEAKIFGTADHPWVSLQALNAAGEAIGGFCARLHTTPDLKVPVATPPPTQSTPVGKPITPVQLVATESPTSYAVTFLPAGLTLNTATGVISGTPTKESAGNPPACVFTATNAAGTSEAVTFGWKVTKPSTTVDTGISSNSDSTSTVSLQVCNYCSVGSPIRDEEGIGTASSTIKVLAELFKNRSNALIYQPLAGFSGRLPTAAEAANLGSWATAINGGGNPVGGKFIEFGNETNYQIANNKTNGETYGTRAKEAADAILATGTGVKLLVQGSDAGTGQHSWLDGIFAAWPGILTHAAFGGWTIHSYPGGTTEQSTDTFGVPMMERMVKALEEHGDSTKPIFVTEWGVPTTNNGRTMTSGQSYNWSEGAKVLERHKGLLETASKGRMVQLLLYQNHDQKADDGVDTEREHFFGAVQLAGAEKGAFTTFVKSFL